MCRAAVTGGSSGPVLRLSLLSFALEELTRRRQRYELFVRVCAVVREHLLNQVLGIP